MAKHTLKFSRCSLSSDSQLLRHKLGIKNMLFSKSHGNSSQGFGEGLIHLRRRGRINYSDTKGGQQSDAFSLNRDQLNSTLD